MESRIGLWKWPCRADDMGGNIPKGKLTKRFYSVKSFKVIQNPGGARLQGEPSGEGGYNTREDLPRPGCCFSIFGDEHLFWQEIRTLTIIVSVPT